MLSNNFILPSSGSMTIDGTIIIVIATIFVVVYLYKNKDNLKSNEKNFESNIETNVLSNKEKLNSVEEEINDTAQADNRNPNLFEEGVVEQEEKVKLY